METSIQEVEQTIAPVQDDPLAKFRAEIAAEKTGQRGKMSDAELVLHPTAQGKNGL